MGQGRRRLAAGELGSSWVRHAVLLPTHLELGCLVSGRVRECMELLPERRSKARIRVEHEAGTAQRDCFAPSVHIRDLRGKATAHGVAVRRALLESIEERVLLIVQHNARRRDRCDWLIADIRWTSCF